MLDRIVENGSKQIALKPVAPEPAVAALRKKYPSASDDERLLRYMFAGSQVDDMLREKGSTTYEYQHEHSIVALLKHLAASQDRSRAYFARRFPLNIVGS